MRWYLFPCSLVVAALSGCGAHDGDDSGFSTRSQALQPKTKKGEKLFDQETFKGNGRACATCHSESTSGTFSPSDAQALFAEDPSAALFRSIDSDDGVGNAYNRLLGTATIRVDIPTTTFRPSSDLTASHVGFNRGVPTVLNVGLNDDVLMSDGREPSLGSQAVGAVHAHYQNTEEPKANEVADIVAYEQTLFSNATLANFFAGGPPPQLPAGTTAAEQRGRAFFNADRQCGRCHGGPMLNETSEFNTQGAGVRFEQILAGEPVFVTVPVITSAPIFWSFVDPGSGTEIFQIPVPFRDPGRAIVSGNPNDFGFFKIPTLWGVKNTAPYFHDGSSRNLEDVLNHYQEFFPITGGVIAPITDQDRSDIIAFVELL